MPLSLNIAPCYPTRIHLALTLDLQTPVSDRCLDLQTPVSDA